MVYLCCKLSFAFQSSSRACKYDIRRLQFCATWQGSNISSDIIVISAPVSILKSMRLLLILSPILHGSSYSSLDETAPKKKFSYPLGSSELYLTSDAFFVRQTAAKCPVLLQFLYCLPLAGQISVRRCLRLHLPQRLPSCWRYFSSVRQNYFPFFRRGTWP